MPERIGPGIGARLDVVYPGKAASIIIDGLVAVLDVILNEGGGGTN